MRRALHAFPIVLIALAAMIGLSTQACAGVVEERETLYSDYARQLEELAAWCESHQLDEAAQQLKAWLPKREPEQLTLFLLSSSAEDAASHNGTNAEWLNRWQHFRDEHADRLYDLARRAVREHHLSLACELVTEAVRENPQHKRARRWLGYVKLRDRWYTPFEARQLSAGKVWDPRFGWLPKAHVARYEKGQRYYQGRWMPAEEEARLRGDVKRGWRIETAHYVVTTNHSLEEGVRLAEQLETLFAIWQQVFIAFVADESELQRRFEGRAARAETRQHNVVYYRTRDEYNDALRSEQPKIDITLGIYLDTSRTVAPRTAYFFAGDDQDAGTLFHEATHQLFYETRPTADEVGRRDNFWIIEGIACYMESLSTREGYYTLGGMNAARMPAARHRLLEDNFYVPLVELVTIGRGDLQQDNRIAKLYSQSAGLADFLMHGEHSRYREPLVQYLSAIYAGRATTSTLAELTRTSYDTLDRQYRAFMREGAANETTSDAAR